MPPIVNDQVAYIVCRSVTKWALQKIQKRSRYRLHSGGPRERPITYSGPLRANTVLCSFNTIQPSRSKYSVTYHRQYAHSAYAGISATQAAILRVFHPQGQRLQTHHRKKVHVRYLIFWWVLVIFWCQRSRRICNVTLNAGAKYRLGMLKWAIFDQYLAILETVQDKDSYYGRLIGTSMRCTKCCYFHCPRVTITTPNHPIFLYYVSPFISS